MSPNDSKVLCVSIHDVAPQTWPDCLRLLRALREVADIPVTFLVVPHYHGRQTRSDTYEEMLDDLLAQGHELALHGYTHLDSGPVRPGLYNRFIRSVYTRQEGEFAAIDAAEAGRRLELGLAWFRQRNWPVNGFVAPAWLLGEGGWAALRNYPFEYTTTIGRFHLLPERQSLLSPTLVYTARNAAGRFLSPQCANLMAPFLQMAPLARLSLHPSDARYPELVRHCQRLLAKLLMTHAPLTKVSFAHRWRTRHEGALLSISRQHG